MNHDDLRALAGAADPDGWVAGLWPENGVWTFGYLSNAYTDDEDTVRYVAAVSPDVVLGLLDEIDRLRAIVDDFVPTPQERASGAPLLPDLELPRASTELPVPSDRVVDLMAALEMSVAAAKQARTRHPHPPA